MPYLTPDEIPEEDACRPLFIPDDTAWLAIVSGALTELTKPWNWQQDGAVTVEEAVERMQALIDQYYADECGDCDLPDGGKIIQIGADGRFYEACGDDWCEPTGDYEIPPPAAREEPTEDERRCLAAANAENVLSQLYEESVDMFNEHLSTAEALLALGIAIGTFIAPPVGLAARSFLAIIGIIFGEFFAFLDFISEDVWDADFSKKLKCVLYECSADDAGVVTFDYGCLFEQLQGYPEAWDFSYTQIRLIGQVLFLLNVISIDGLNLAGATTAIEEANCDDCDPEWCWNSIAETDLGTGWTAHDNPPWSTDLATWSSPNWVGADKRISSASYSRVAWVERSFAETRVTNVTMEFDVEKGGAASTSIALAEMFGDGVKLAGQTFAATTNGVQTLAWVGSELLETVQVFVRSSQSPSASYSGNLSLFRITMRGVGVNPFGDDNCGE